MSSKAASSTIFWVFRMTRPGIEPQSPGPLAKTLLIRPIRLIYAPCIYISQFEWGFLPFINRYILYDIMSGCVNASLSQTFLFFIIFRTVISFEDISFRDEEMMSCTSFKISTNYGFVNTTVWMHHQGANET